MNDEQADVEEMARLSDRLRQLPERTASLTNGNGPWTVVCDSWHTDEHNGGRYAAFATPQYRSRALSSAAWDLLKGHGGPGFVQRNEDGVAVTEYERSSANDGVEPLIIWQEFDGVVPDTWLLSEEFRLLMHLWEDRQTGSFYAIGSDGSKELAVKVEDERISVRTPLLRRYQAARQLDLLLFIDSVHIVQADLQPDAFSDIAEDDHAESDNTVVYLGVGRYSANDRGVFSRLLVKRVLPPPPPELCGLWPWEITDERYPEFIIGEDDNGRSVQHTCDPDKLANYFGKNPDAPHYLTPVFFRPEVLRRYYDDPATYSVTDGLLMCAHLWSVQIDNGDPDVVMVFLGDIGKSIPNNHREYWRSQNIPPVGPISETHFRRSFYAEFAKSANPEHVFKNAYRNALITWPQMWGWSLYREPTGSDAQALPRVRIPLDDTDTEFEAQLLDLAKLLVDLLNEEALVQGLPKVKDEKGISKFERFLKAAGYTEVERDVALLRRIQTLRSRLSAHASGAGGQALLAKELDGRSKREFIKDLMRDATRMLDGLADLRPSEPLASP